MLSEDQLNCLYRYGYSLAQDESAGFDLLHDALQRYLELDGDKQPKEGVEFYIRRCMRNRFIDQLRHDQRFPQDSFDESADVLVSVDTPDPAELVADQQLLDAIWKRLTPLESELLYLWAHEQWTAQEIADQQETPRGTILSRLHRLRRKIISLTADGGDLQGHSYS